MTKKTSQKVIKGALKSAAEVATPKSLVTLGQMSTKPFRVDVEDRRQLEITAKRIFLIKGSTRNVAPDGKYVLTKGGTIVVKGGVIDAVQGKMRLPDNDPFFMFSQEQRDELRPGETKPAIAKSTFRAFSKKTGAEVEHIARNK